MSIGENSWILVFAVYTTMIIEQSFRQSIILAVLLAWIAIMCTGCAKIRDLTDDKTYLTPIPQATLDAYQYSQPVKTRLQAVIAAQNGIMTFHMDWVGQPTAIFAEAMNFKAAVRRVEQPGTTSYYDPTTLIAWVWLVVFEGKYTITEPSGTVIAPISGCAYSVVNAKDGMGMIAGALSCERLKLD